MRILARVAVVLLVAAAVLPLIAIVGLFSHHLPPMWVVDAAEVLVDGVMGPILLMATTAAARPIALATLIGVAVCAAASWHLSRKFPESEAYGVPIVVAAVLWVLSPWVVRMLR